MYEILLKITTGFFDSYNKTAENLVNHGNKVEEEDPTVLLPKIGADIMTQRLSRGCQKVNKPLLNNNCRYL